MGRNSSWLTVWKRIRCTNPSTFGKHLFLLVVLGTSEDLTRLEMTQIKF